MLQWMAEQLKRLQFYVERSIVGGINVPQTLSVQLDLTHACNLNCSHCYHHEHVRKDELNFEQWLDVLNQYNALRKKLAKDPSVIFCGGEPLLSEHFFPMLDAVRNRWPGCQVSVLTNGTLIGPHLFAHKSLDGIRFQVSFDGIDAATHNCARGSNAFERSVSGLAYLRERGALFSLQAVLSKRTEVLISEFFLLAKELGATEMNFARMVAVGNASNLVANALDAPLEGSELKDALMRILIASRATGIATNTAKPLFNVIDANRGASQYLGFQGIVIDPAGNIKVSSRAAVVIGSVLAEGLEKTFLTHQTLLRLRAGLIESCGDCPHFRKCGGDRNVAFAKSGSFFSKDPGCWL